MTLYVRLGKKKYLKLTPATKQARRQERLLMELLRGQKNATARKEQRTPAADPSEVKGEGD